MNIYWTVFFVTFLISIFPVKSNRQHLIRLFIAFIPLFLYGAFRDNFGLDFNSYADYFNSVKVYNKEADERIEIGYFYLNKILPSFRALLVLQTLLLCSSYYYLFKCYIPRNFIWLGFLFLFLNGPISIFFMLSGIRNSIAISIIIFSSRFIYQRKFIYFLISVFIAYHFHNSIILIAPFAYFLTNSSGFTKKNILLWVLIMLSLVIFSSSILVKYVDLFISNYFDRYISYLEVVKNIEQKTFSLAVIFSFVVSSLVLFIFYDKKLTNKELTNLKLLLLFLASFLLGSLNLRFSQFFAPFFIIGSLIVVYKCKNIPLKVSYLVVIFSYFIYAFKVWFDSPYFSYDIYQSVLF